MSGIEFTCAGCGASVHAYPIEPAQPQTMCLTCRTVASVEPHERIGMWRAMTHGEPFPEALRAVPIVPLFDA